MNIFRQVIRIKNRIYVQFIAPVIEKSFVYNGETIHYLHYKKKSDFLLVCFSAYNDNGPRYDYVTSLSKYPLNRLYIKDDFVEKTGNYYLGRNGNYSIEDAVFHLIEKIKEEDCPKKLIFIGSSKGGYAALNFGIRFKNASVIVAAPQYKLGDYMYNTAKKFRPALEDIVGMPVTEEKIRNLNQRLSGKINDDKEILTQSFYIHCSSNDRTYEKHVKYLLEDLAVKEAKVHFDLAAYEGHDTLKYHFPKYLCECIEKELATK